MSGPPLVFHERVYVAGAPTGVYVHVTDDGGKLSLEVMRANGGPLAIGPDEAAALANAIRRAVSFIIEGSPEGVEEDGDEQPEVVFEAGKMGGKS